jgi:hypothetical protein
MLEFFGKKKKPEKLSDLRVGDEVAVGEFFWIRSPQFIGFDHDAKHGHGISHKHDSEYGHGLSHKEGSPGSADTDCTVVIRAINDDEAIVSLQRDEIPYGAKAPIGTVFLVKVETLKLWPTMALAHHNATLKRNSLADQFCTKGERHDTID